MPISHLRIINYRSLGEVDIRPGRVNIVTGPAGVGKSSIAEAIRYLLTGRNQWCDDRGVGLSTQVALGQKKAGVSAEWVAPVTGEVSTFERSIPAPSGVKALQEKIDQALGVPSDIVAAQLATRRFLQMSAKEQEDLLQGLLSPPLDIDRWVDELNKWDESPQSGPGLGEWFDPHFDKIPAKKTPLEYAEIERRAAKKVRDEVLQEIRVKEAAAQPQVVTEEDVEATRAAYTKLSNKLATLRERASGGGEVYAAQHAAWTQLGKQHADAVATVESIDRNLAEALGKRRPDLPPVASADLSAQLPEAEQKVTDLQAKLDAFNGEYDALVGASGPCPKGTCARGKMEEINQKQIAIRSELESAKADLRRLEGQIQQAKFAEDTLSSMAAFEAQLQRNLDEAQARLESLPALGDEPQAPPVEDDGLAALEADLAKLAQEGKDLAKARSAWEAWERSQADLNKQRKRLATLETDVARWEAVFAAFGPRGVKSKLMGASLQEMATEISGLLGEYFGAQFRITQEPWSIEVDLGDGWLPAGQLSWSWQARVSACLQLVLAQRSGFPVVVLDETGADPLVRTDLITLFDDADDVQAFILSTSQRVSDLGNFIRPTPEPEDAEAGVLTWWVEGGRVECLDLQPA